MFCAFKSKLCWLVFHTLNCWSLLLLLMMKPNQPQRIFGLFPFRSLRVVCVDSAVPRLFLFIGQVIKGTWVECVIYKVVNCFHGLCTSIFYSVMHKWSKPSGQGRIPSNKSVWRFLMSLWFTHDFGDVKKPDVESACFIFKSNHGSKVVNELFCSWDFPTY